MAKKDSDSIPELVRNYQEHLRTGGSKSPEEFLRTQPGAREDALPALEIVRGLTGTDEVIGPYKLVRELGRGAQATVYLAEDTRLGRKVALKLLAHAGRDVESYLRFRREAESASRLDHPGICTIYEAGVADGVPYLAMRYVDGAPLTDHIGADEPRAERLERLERVARALHAAHEGGLVHRDIKPGNIMVTHDGDPVLCDFGLARDTGTDHAALTRTGEAHGTPAYMSPEQLAGKPLDRRSDVFSLGIVLYEYLTGARPFEAATLDELYRRILQTEPPPTRLPRDLRVVLQTALEKDRTRRYATALDLAEDLRRVREGEPVRARPPSVLRRARRWVQRHPAATVALALVFAGAAVFSWQQRRSLEDIRAEKDRAEFRTYLANVFAADASLDSADPGAAQPRLEACEPARRGWEWHYLALRADTSLSTRTLPTPTLRCIVVSPDGERMAISTGQSTITVWTIGATKPTFTLKGHTSSRVRTVAFSPDGALLASGANDRTVRLWDPATGKQLHTLRGHRSSLHDIVFSRDGRRLYSASYDRTIRVWDVATRQCLRELTYPEPMVSLALLGEDKLIAGSDRGKAWVTDLVSGEHTSLLDTAEGRIAAIRVRDGGDRAVLCTRAGHAHVVDPATGRRIAVLRGHRAFCVSAAFLPGDRIATAARDGTLRTWRMTGEPLATQSGHRRAITSMALAPDGTALTVSFDGTIKQWSLAPRGRHAPFYDNPTIVEAVAFDPTDARLAVGGWDGLVRVLDVATGDIETVLRGHDRRLRVIRFSPDGRRIATGAEDRTLRLWDAATGAPVAVMRGHQSHVSSIAFTPDGTRLVSCGADGTIRVWNAETAEQESLFAHGPAGFARIALSRDGARLAAAAADGSARVWEFGSRRLLATLELGGRGLRAVAFHPEGRLVACGEYGGVVHLWDFESGRHRRLVGHTSHVNACVFSPDGTRLVTASHDSTARLWDTATGETTLALRGHDSLLTDVAFSRDGQRIATAAHDTDVRVWEVGLPARYHERMRERAVLRENARPTVDRLFAEHGFSLDVIAAADDPTVIRIAREREERPNLLATQAWEILRAAGGTPDEYGRAKLLVERAYRLTPRPFLLRLLGAAHYRLGDHAAALGPLDRYMTVMRRYNWSIRPDAAAFLAMTLHRLGERERATEELAVVEQAVEKPRHGEHAEMRALLDEARALIR